MPDTYYSQMTPGRPQASDRAPHALAFREAPLLARLIRLCTAAVMAITVLNWVGWVSGDALLTSLSPSWVAMTPWTALLLFLLAGATHAQMLPSPVANRRGRVMATAAGIVSLTFLGEYATGKNWGVDLLWFHNAVMNSPVAYPGRLAPGTAIAVLAMSITILQLRSVHKQAERLTQFALAVALFPAVASGVGYAAGALGVFEFDTTTGMAFITALCMWLIGMAAMAARPDRLPLNLFAVRPDRLSMMRLLLVFLLSPVMLLLGEYLLHEMGTPDRASIVLSDVFVAVVVGIAVFAVSSGQQRMLLQQAALTGRLQASEQRYRVLAENGSDVILTGPPDGRIDWVSDSVERTLGWQPQDLVGRHGLQFIHPDDRPGVELVLLRVAAGEPQRLEARWLRADGTSLWMSGLLGPERDAAGLAVGRISNWRDISSEHQAREELAAERELLAVNMQALLDPLVLFKAVRDDAGVIVDFTYLDANDAACAHTGLPREQLIGAHLSQRRTVAKESGLLELYASAVETGAPLAIDDFPLTDKDGGVQYLDIRGRRASGDRLSVTWRNVTERRQSAAAVAASEEHYRLLAENTADVVFRLRDGVVLWMSPSVRDALGGDADTWIGRDVTALIHPEDLLVYAEGMVSVRQGESIVRRARILDDQGSFHWVEVHAKQYLNPDGTVDGAVCSLHIVDADVAAQEVLERLARFDDLTGLLNRGEALRRMSAATSRLRTQGKHTAVLFCDVDHFKQVNDTLGHAAGDEVLRVLAQRTRDCVRTADLVARMGGDEIMVVLLDLIDTESATRVAEKIRSSATKPIHTSAGIVHTSMSIGVTAVTEGEDPDELIARADSAMYEAKSIGRNRVIRVG